MVEEIERVLDEFGLSGKEVKIYFYLAKSGLQKAIEISKSLGVHKVEVYRFLKNLENKGLAESTLERPTRFSATPFEQVLESLISERRKFTTALEEQKKTILNQWKSMNAQKLPAASERFVVLSGRDSVYLRILNLVKHTQSEISGITTNVNLLLEERNGFLSQGINEVVERGRNVRMRARLIAQVTTENLEIVKSYSKKLQRHRIYAEIRHLSLDTKFVPRFAIRDSEETVFFLTSRDRSLSGREETGLWTNSKEVVCALQTLFEEMWKDSKPLSERIVELEKQNTNP